MTTLVPLLAAAGLLLVFLGIPSLRTGRMTARVEPYLTGLKGKPSKLLVSAGASRWFNAERWLERRLGHLGLSKDRYLAERLAAAGCKMAPSAYRLDQVVWAVTSVVASWALITAAVASGLHIDLRSLPVLTMTAFACGFLGRDWWLGKEMRLGGQGSKTSSRPPLIS